MEDERRHGERRCFQSHPEQREMLAQCHERGGTEEAEQTADEHAPAALSLATKVAHRMERRREEEDAGEREHDEAQRISCQPAAEHRRRGHDPERRDQREVRRRHGHEHADAPAYEAARRSGERHRGGQRGKRTERDQAHQSVNSSRRAESSESNSRLMWKMTMPMTNTTTKRSSRTPSSSRNGMLSVCVSPKR